MKELSWAAVGWAVSLSAGPLLLSWLTTNVVQWLLIPDESVPMKQNVQYCFQ